MKLFPWINNKSKEDGPPPQQKDYLKKLVSDFESLMTRDENIAFRVKDIKPHGFIIKTNGLYGYVSFQFMPWTYKNISCWTAIFPHLKRKTFFGRVYHFKKEPLSIIFNAQVPQFKKMELTENEQYDGIIIKKTGNGALIDIGFHYNWHYGSIPGYLDKSEFEDKSQFEAIIPGETIQTRYWGIHQNQNLVLGLTCENTEWFNGKIDLLPGQILPVEITKNKINGKLEYLVDGKFSGSMCLNKNIYNFPKKRLANALKLLKEYDIIHCEIIEVNKKKRTLLLKWEMENEIETMMRRKTQLIVINEKNKIEFGYSNPNSNFMIENRISHETAEKLQLIDKTHSVLVSKTITRAGKNKNRYTINSKYNAKVYFSNNRYRINKKDKKRIEEQLQDGDFMECTVVKIAKDKIYVKWEIEDDELIRFLK
jgi:hypothetical protein